MPPVPSRSPIFKKRAMHRFTGLFAFRREAAVLNSSAWFFRSCRPSFHPTCAGAGIAFIKHPVHRHRICSRSVASSTF